MAANKEVLLITSVRRKKKNKVVGGDAPFQSFPYGSSFNYGGD